MTTTDTQTQQRTTPAHTIAEQVTEFRLDIVTSPEPGDPAAVVWFKAEWIAEAIEQARRFLAAHQGPDDRYGELYQRNGHWGDFLTTIHLGA